MTGRARSTVALRWYRPTADTAAAGTPTLLWLHGGGFFRGGLDQPEAHAVASALARRGVTVVTAGYRLAPVPGTGWLPGRARRGRVRYPLPLEDVLAALGEVRAAVAGGVVLGGASAGACLAAAAALRTVDEGAPVLGAVLAYGFFHAVHPPTLDARARSRRHRRITHARWALDVMNRNYAGTRRALRERDAFPGGHDLAGFPRALLVAAEHDNMRASGDRFADELTAAGIEVEHHVLPGSRHAFLNHPGTAAFRQGVDRIGRWLTASRWPSAADSDRLTA